MFIQTETTPNPNTLKFLPGLDVMEQGKTKMFHDASRASESPLAEALFKVEGVSGVFYGADFISVTKAEDSNWDLLKPHVLTTIMEHFVTKRPLFVSDQQEKTAGDAVEGDSDIVVQIKELIDTRVRPAVAEDGGDIVYAGFENGIVLLELYGACSGCPSSTVTLKDGIENMLKHYVPEVIAVEAVNGQMDL